ncbi:ABC transporter permease [Aneurinibacillus sp. REN35]|uniref:ABC transporter permease n=1 Tax=Aneurinibacillus sp. REN35 TaxID=3237286 RepID=UPI003527C42F
MSEKVIDKTVEVQNFDSDIKSKSARNIKAILLKNDTVIALVGICLILSLSSDYFLTFSNFTNVLQQVSLIGIIAVGMTFVICSAEIDLSVGSVVALTGSLVGVLSSTYNVPIFLSVIIGLLAGLLVGFLMGTLSIKLIIPSFIVTLASMMSVRGIAFLVTGGYPAPINSDFLQLIGQGKTLGIPNSSILFFLVVLIGYHFLERSRFGRYVLAVGGNKESAKVSGIPVTKIRLTVFSISGLLAGLSGVLLAGQFGSGSPNAGNMYELDAIAAVVLGGANLYGGKGRIIGTVMGVLIIGVINNGLNLLNVSPYYQMVVKGLVILMALGLNKFKQN